VKDISHNLIQPFRSTKTSWPSTNDEDVNITAIRYQWSSGCRSPVMPSGELGTHISAMVKVFRGFVRGDFVDSAAFQISHWPRAGFLSQCMRFVVFLPRRDLYKQ